MHVIICSTVKPMSRRAYLCFCLVARSKKRKSSLPSVPPAKRNIIIIMKQHQILSELDSAVPSFCCDTNLEGRAWLTTLGLQTSWNKLLDWMAFKNWSQTIWDRSGLLSFLVTFFAEQQREQHKKAYACCSVFLSCHSYHSRAQGVSQLTAEQTGPCNHHGQGTWQHLSSLPYRSAWWLTWYGLSRYQPKGQIIGGRHCCCCTWHVVQFTCQIICQVGLTPLQTLSTNCTTSIWCWHPCWLR